ncbi:MAG: cyclic peptide export ABC transporter [Xenophilus sp.]
MRPAPHDRVLSATLAELLRLLRPHLGWLLLSALAGSAAGAATVALLARLTSVVQQPGGMRGGMLPTLLALCALILAGRALSLAVTNWVGQRVVAKVRQALARKILAAPIDALERYRTHRLVPVLTHDVDTISSTVFAFAALAIAIAVSIGCLLYLAWLSLPMFGLLVLALGVGTLVQQLAQKRGVAGFQAARDAEESLHKAYRSLGEGAKELRLHRRRRQHVFERGILETIDRIARVNTRATNIFVVAGAFGSALYFLLIVLVLGWAAGQVPDPAAVAGFVLVLLYLKGPLDQIASILPAVGRARVALERIADLSARFSTPEPIPLCGEPGGEPPAETLRECIELRGVTYGYAPGPDEARDASGGSDGMAGLPASRFEVGPLDLRIDKGSIVFIVGANGSGKTTLVKLLLGLYAPQAGQLLLDGRPVTTDGRDAYRQLFGTVLSDFHLFEELIGDGEPGSGPPGADGAGAAAAQACLDRLDIAHKVSIRSGAFSTLDLSTGQRKRLALVHAYLEGRQVLVFDEWAADQDPAFRRLFYRELLPELRARGHTLVVISHDERYFDVADQLVRIQNGRIVSRSMGQPAPPEPRSEPVDAQDSAYNDAVREAA